MQAQQGGLPYDAEIEYLEFVGGQIIDSGIPFSYTTGDNTSIDIDVQITADYNATQIIGGGGDGGTQWFGNSSGYYACGGSAAQRLPILSSTRANLYFSVFKSGKNFKSTLSSGGTSVTLTRTTSSGYNNVTIGGVPGFYANMKVWYSRIYSGANLVRDFIPVRVGQVGYMYDRVSGQLFGNSGTGDFILGPDVQ